MRVRILLVLCLCAVVVGAIAAGPKTRRARSAQATRQSTQQRVAILKGVQDPQQMQVAFNANAAQSSVWAVNVDSTLNLDPSDQQLYQSLANVLAAVTSVPNDRLNYWSAVNGSTSGWFGSVSAVAVDGNGGYLVTVMVSPRVNTPTDGSLIAILGSYTEQWDIDTNNNATFVQSFDPEGVAGQSPTLISM